MLPGEYIGENQGVTSCGSPKRISSAYLKSRVEAGVVRAEVNLLASTASRHLIESEPLTDWNWPAVGHV